MVVQQSPALVLRVGPAAASLAMGENELRERLRAGEISHYTTPGGHYRIPVAALEAFGARRCEESRLEAAS